MQSALGHALLPTVADISSDDLFTALRRHYNQAVQLSSKTLENIRLYPGKMLLFGSPKKIPAPATGVINRTTVVKDDSNHLFAESSLGTTNSSMCRQRNRHAGTALPICCRPVPDQSGFQDGHCSVAPVGVPMAKSSSCIPSTTPVQSASFDSSF